MDTLKSRRAVLGADQVLGIKLLDGQHQKLLRLCDMAHECALGASEYNGARFRDIVKDVSVWSSEHFYAEEEFMKKHSYAGLERHAAKHTEFEEALAAFLTRASDGGSDATDRAFAVFLRDWFTTHIQEEDQHFKRESLPC